MRRILMALVPALAFTVGCDDDEPATADMMVEPGADMLPELAPDMMPEPEADMLVEQGGPLALTILHVNDHHSHVTADDFGFDVSGLELTATANAAGDPLAEVEVTYGGYPLLVSLFAELEAANENVLKLHAGDAITGTLFYPLFSGQADAEMMNQVCFDAFGLGNHEFDDGDAALARFLDFLAEGDCGTPVVAANVVPGPDSPLANGYLVPYVIEEVAGQQVGLIGIDIARKTMVSSAPDPGTVLTDETETAQRYIDELTGMGVDKIVLLTHYTYENDLALAAALTGVDVIVGGDSHSLLGGENLGLVGNPAGPYPTQATNADGEPVCVVQAWEYAHLLGELQVQFDADGIVESCAGSPRVPFDGATFTYEYVDGKESSDRVLEGADVDAVREALAALPEFVAVEADPDTAAVLAGYEAQVSELSTQVIGTIAEDLCLERWPGQARSAICPPAATYANGSDISNHVAKAFLTVTPTADISLQNAGGTRTDVAAGEHTINDAYSLLPFSNTLWTLEMTGEEIVATLEDALSNTLDDDGSTGSYPYAAGLRFDVDASAAFGERVSNVQVNPRLAGAWTDIDPAGMYTVVTQSFIGAGRDGYDTLGVVSGEGLYVDTFTEYAQSWVDYINTFGEEAIGKLPIEEYSTQRYVGRDGCDHSMSADCEGW